MPEQDATVPGLPTAAAGQAQVPSQKLAQGQGKADEQPDEQSGSQAEVNPCARTFLEGAGWRIGWDPTAQDYPGLVGGETWAMELTGPEFADFCRLTQELAQAMADMETLVMAEERLSLEAESDRLYLAAEGFPHSYDLAIILNQGRRGEGYWPVAAVPDLLKAVQRLHSLAKPNP